MEITSQDTPVAAQISVNEDRLRDAKQLRSAAPVDTGWSEELAEDDALSCDDLSLQ